VNLIVKVWDKTTTAGIGAGKGCIKGKSEFGKNPAGNELAVLDIDKTEEKLSEKENFVIIF
jgi:hypothetical protein